MGSVGAGYDNATMESVIDYVPPVKFEPRRLTMTG
jgi:hypothetical protein